MYKSIAFPVATTEAVRFEDFSVFVDPTFACVVVQYQLGYDIFRYDDEVCSFDFECAEFADTASLMRRPNSVEVSSALWHLWPWLDAEVAAVKAAWIEFFDGSRQLPLLTPTEKRTLLEMRMRLIAGLSGAQQACIREAHGSEGDRKRAAMAL